MSQVNSCRDPDVGAEQEGRGYSSWLWGKGGNGGLVFSGDRFLVLQDEAFWRQMVMMVVQEYECT